MSMTREEIIDILGDRIEIPQGQSNCFVDWPNVSKVFFWEGAGCEAVEWTHGGYHTYVGNVFKDSESLEEIEKFLAEAI